MSLSLDVKVLLAVGVNEACSFEPVDVMPYIQSALTLEEYNDTKRFLAWMNRSGLLFTYDNIDEMHSRFLTSTAKENAVAELNVA